MTEPLRVERLDQRGHGTAWWWIVLAGTLGTISLVTAYLALRPRLPNEIPSHFGAGGQVTATMSPETFVFVGLAIEAGLTAVLALVLFASLRSGLVVRQQGPGIARTLGALLSVVAAVSVPVPWIFLLAGDSGVLPFSAALLAGLLVPLAAIVLVAGVAVRTIRTGSGRRPDGGPQFRCSSCGDPFVTSTLAGVLSPHIGASVYLRCPRCGERGWDMRC